MVAQNSELTRKAKNSMGSIEDYSNESAQLIGQAADIIDEILTEAEHVSDTVNKLLKSSS